MWIKVFCIGCKWVLVLVWIGLEEYILYIYNMYLVGVQYQYCPAGLRISMS